MRLLPPKEARRINDAQERFLSQQRHVLEKKIESLQSKTSLEVKNSEVRKGLVEKEFNNFVLSLEDKKTVIRQQISELESTKQLLESSLEYWRKKEWIDELNKKEMIIQSRILNEKELSLIDKERELNEKVENLLDSLERIKEKKDKLEILSQNLEDRNRFLTEISTNLEQKQTEFLLSSSKENENIEQRKVKIIERELEMQRIEYENKVLQELVEKSKKKVYQSYPMNIKSSSVSNLSFLWKVEE